MVHRTDIAGGSADRQVLAVAACAAVHLNGSSSKTILRPRLVRLPRLFPLPRFFPLLAQATRSAAAYRRQFHATMPTISNS